MGYVQEAVFPYAGSPFGRRDPGFGQCFTGGLVELLACILQIGTLTGAPIAEGINILSRCVEDQSFTGIFIGLLAC